MSTRDVCRGLRASCHITQSDTVHVACEVKQ